MVFVFDLGLYHRSRCSGEAADHRDYTLGPSFIYMKKKFFSYFFSSVSFFDSGDVSRAQARKINESPQPTPPPAFAAASFKSLLSPVDVNGARVILSGRCRRAPRPRTFTHPAPNGRARARAHTRPRVLTSRRRHRGQMTRETSTCKINEHPAPRTHPSSPSVAAAAFGTFRRRRPLHARAPGRDGGGGKKVYDDDDAAAASGVLPACIAATAHH